MDVVESPLLGSQRTFVRGGLSAELYSGSDSRFCQSRGGRRQGCNDCETGKLDPRSLRRGAHYKKVQESGQRATRKHG